MAVSNLAAGEMEREKTQRREGGKNSDSSFRARAFVLQSLKMDFQNGTNETEGYAMEVIFRDHRLAMAVICSSSLTLGLPLAINMLSQLKVGYQFSILL